MPECRRQNHALRNRQKGEFTEGLLFTTYSTLARKSKGDSPDKSKINENRNFKGITNLLGDDFDGLVIFDEIDKAASVGTEEGEKKKYYERGASDNYLGVQALHKKFRNAGALYGSGTAMTKDYKSALSMINLPLYGDGLSISNRHAFKEMLDTYGLPFWRRFLIACGKWGQSTMPDKTAMA